LLTAVIVNYNGWPDVCRLVASLARTPEVLGGVCRVVVVDNASDDPVPEELAELGPGVRVIVERHNGGFAAGVNSGWRAARTPWILVLNPDVVIPEGELSAIVARAERFQAVPDQAPGIVGFALRNPDGSRQPSVGAFPNLVRTLWEQLIPRSRRKYQPGWRTRAGSVDWVTGACVLVNSRMLEQLDGMDEDFFLYYEEVALCRAARDRRWDVRYDDGVEVVHLHPLQNRAISPKMRVITRHSKLLYFRKHLPAWQFRVLSALVTAEAMVHGAWAKVHGRTEDGHSWRTIAEVARAFRAGVEPRGRDVLTLAESVPGPALRDRLERAPAPAASGPAGKRRETSAAAPLQPRKDGPACR
jgi:GT2 family glycosyltransferase